MCIYICIVIHIIQWELNPHTTGYKPFSKCDATRKFEMPRSAGILKPTMWDEAPSSSQQFMVVPRENDEDIPGWWFEPL